VLVTLLNASPRPARAQVVLRGRASGEAWVEVERRAVRLGPEEVQATLWALPGPARELEIQLEHEGGARDALGADDRVRLVAGVLRVAFATSLPPAHRAAVHQALLAVLGEAGLLEVPSGASADLEVERWDGGEERGASAGAGRAVLALAVVEGEGRPVPDGPERRAAHRCVRDVTFQGLDMRRPAGAFEGLRWLLQRDGDDARGLVGIDAVGRLVVAFDVTRGEPSPAQRPGWPILVENLLGAVLGVEGGVPRAQARASPTSAPGVRRQGLLDPASTRLGRDQRALDVEWLRAAPPRERVHARPLAPWCVALGLGLLGVLGWREARRGGVAR
jgi:hypothetical protein